MVGLAYLIKTASRVSITDNLNSRRRPIRDVQSRRHTNHPQAEVPKTIHSKLRNQNDVEVGAWVVSNGHVDREVCFCVLHVQLNGCSSQWP